MRKILYLMHVDWHWIKQRPHFIAEYLSVSFQMRVCYSRALKSSLLSNNSLNPDISIKPFYRVPFRKKYTLLYLINKYFYTIYFKFKIIKEKPDIIWITHPEFVDYIKYFKGYKIYDCMDDILSLEDQEPYIKRMRKLEKYIFEKYDVAFISSNHLLSKINERYLLKTKYQLLRNAYNGNILKSDININNTSKKYRIGYIGTISSWFDLELLEYSLSKFSNIEYHLIGPTDRILEQNENIKTYGPIEHSKLFDVVKSFDCLIMPFIVNDITKSVDPVKIYEYINFDKSIICVYYKELERFNDFVFFYYDKDSFIETLNKMVNNHFTKKYNSDERLSFLMNNNWETRAQTIIKVINNECR